ncbi:unnamed protein product [Ambrosiozyma monospora]|uniref:Unnamed protein product n=1 Tax=Ambrosiozyma monospora TaxID=43982 RepID=A0A9W6YVM1_AMBMO|nr:unnamed protein product [Ambrosiozyma monospora]
MINQEQLQLQDPLTTTAMYNSKYIQSSVDSPQSHVQSPPQLPTNSISAASSSAATISSLGHNNSTGYNLTNSANLKLLPPLLSNYLPNPQMTSTQSQMTPTTATFNDLLNGYTNYSNNSNSNSVLTPNIMSPVTANLLNGSTSLLQGYPTNSNDNNNSSLVNNHSSSANFFSLQTPYNASLGANSGLGINLNGLGSHALSQQHQQHQNQHTDCHTTSKINEGIVHISEPPTKKARRTRKACDFCNQKRTKCSGEHPCCQQCAKLGLKFEKGTIGKS